MPLDADIVAGVTHGLERAFDAGRDQGRKEAQQQFFGSSAAVLTARLFAASLGEAAATLREYSPAAAAFFSGKAQEFEDFVTPPQIQSHNPAADATNVARTTDIDVKFANPIREETLTDATFYIGAVTGGPHLGGRILYDTETNTATFVLDNVLSANTSYRVTLHGMRASGGMPLEPEQTFEFVTGSE